MEKASVKPFYLPDHANTAESVEVGEPGNATTDGLSDAKILREKMSGNTKGTALLTDGEVDAPTPLNTELGNVPHKVALSPLYVDTVGPS